MSAPFFLLDNVRRYNCLLNEWFCLYFLHVSALYIARA